MFDTDYYPGELPLSVISPWLLSSSSSLSDWARCWPLCCSPSCLLLCRGEETDWPARQPATTYSFYCPARLAGNSDETESSQAGQAVLPGQAVSSHNNGDFPASRNFWAAPVTST